MGTNFYWLNPTNELYEDHPINHIGKRSAAGLYCYTCGIYITTQSTQYAHMEGMLKDHYNVYTTHPLTTDHSCPNCGSCRSDSGYNAAYKELGFESNDNTELKGVQGVSSFTWTMMKHKSDIMQYLIDDPTAKIIIDEYGRTYTANEFINELKHCKIEFQMYCEFS